ILDEAQHLIRHNTKAVLYEVADHCKQLLDKSGCPILFAGLDTIQSFLLENPQLKRRSAPTIRLRPIDWREKDDRNLFRSEEHTSELQSLMRISHALFCL